MSGLNKVARLSNKPPISLAKRYAVPLELYPSKAAQARYIWKYAKKSKIFRNNADLERAFAKKDCKIAGQDERIAPLEEDLSWMDRMQRIWDRQDEEFARLKEEFASQNKAIADLRERFNHFQTQLDPKKDDAQLQEDYEAAKDKWFEARANIIEKFGNAEAWKERVEKP